MAVGNRRRCDTGQKDDCSRTDPNRRRKGHVRPSRRLGARQMDIFEARLSVAAGEHHGQRSTYEHPDSVSGCHHQFSCHRVADEV